MHKCAWMIAQIRNFSFAHTQVVARCLGGSDHVLIGTSTTSQLPRTTEKSPCDHHDSEDLTHRASRGSNARNAGFVWRDAGQAADRSGDLLSVSGRQGMDLPLGVSCRRKMLAIRTRNGLHQTIVDRHPEPAPRRRKRLTIFAA